MIFHVINVLALTAATVFVVNRAFHFMDLVKAATIPVEF